MTASAANAQTPAVTATDRSLGARQAGSNAKGIGSPLDRIDNRLSSRIDNRLQTRLDKDHVPAKATNGSIEAANQAIRRTQQPR